MYKKKQKKTGYCESSNFVLFIQYYFDYSRSFAFPYRLYFILFNLFIFIYLLFLAVLGPHCSVWASHCGSFSCCRARALKHAGFSRCSTWAQQLWLTAQLLGGMWDLPRPGLEPVSPALAGGFITTALPGKPSTQTLESQLQNSLLGF